MSQSYAETRDAQGRETLELHDDMPVLLLVCCALSVVPVFFFGWEAILFVIANVLVFGSLSSWFLFACRRMRVMIDPAGRTIAFGSRVWAREYAFGDVVRAQLSSQPVAGMSADPGRAQRQAYRVELVLREGENVPLTQGFALFKGDDCQRMVDRINQVLK